MRMLDIGLQKRDKSKMRDLICLGFFGIQSKRFTYRSQNPKEVY